MDAITLLEKMRAKPVFTVADMVGEVKNQNYARLVLHRLVKKGLATRVRRGIYTVHDDPLIFGSHLVYPSYFSLWTALRYYNLTTQLPIATQVMCSRPLEGLKVREEKLVFIETRHMWGYHKESYRGFEIFMADAEKLILDALYRNSPQVSELTEAVEKSDRERLVSYCIRMGSKSIMKRLGYLLERLVGYTSEGLLTNSRDRNIVPLNPLLPKSGKIDSKWGIYVNEVLD